MSAISETYTQTFILLLQLYKLVSDYISEQATGKRRCRCRKSHTFDNDTNPNPSDTIVHEEIVGGQKRVFLEINSKNTRTQNKRREGEEKNLDQDSLCESCDTLVHDDSVAQFANLLQYVLPLLSGSKIKDSTNLVSPPKEILDLLESLYVKQQPSHPFVEPQMGIPGAWFDEAVQDVRNQEIVSPELLLGNLLDDLGSADPQLVEFVNGSRSQVVQLIQVVIERLGLHPSPIASKGNILSLLFPSTDEKLSDFLGIAKSTLAQAQSGARSIPGMLPGAWKVLTVWVVLVIVCWAIGTKRAAVFTITICLFVVALGPDKVKDGLQAIVDQWDNVCSLLKVVGGNDDGVAEPQIDVEGVTNGVAALFFSKEFMKHTGNLDQVTKFFVKNYPLCKQGIADTARFLLELIGVIAASFGKDKEYEAFIAQFCNSDSPIRDFVDRIHKVEEAMFAQNFGYTVENHGILRKLIEDGEAIIFQCKKDRFPNHLLSLVTSGLSRVRGYKKDFDNSGYLRNGLRQEPVCILLRGAPGVFKTQAMQHMAHALVSSTISEVRRDEFESNPESFIYNRQVENEYWDGYDADKVVTLFDDLMQMKDTPGSAHLEPFDIIRSVNENGYLLHMAELKHKGVTHFCSKFIIATTNSAQLDVSSIVDKNALLRRFDFVYTVEPQAPYAKDDAHKGMKAKFDKSKLPLGPLGISTTNPDLVVQFQPYDLVNKRNVGEPILFDKLLELVLTRHGEKEMFYKQKLAELKLRREQAEPQAQLSKLRLFKAPYASCSACSEFMRCLREERYVIYSELDALLYDDERRVNFCRFVASLQNCKELSFPGESLSSYFRSVMRAANEDIIKASLTHINARNFDVVASNCDARVKSIEGRVFSPDGDRGIAEEWYQKFMQTFSDYKNSVVESKLFKEYANVKNVVAMSTTILAAVAAYKWYAGRYRPGHYQSGTGSKKAKINRHARESRRTLHRNFSGNEPQILLTDDVQARDIITKVMKSNMHEISFREDPEQAWTRNGTILFLKDTVALVPHHFVDIYYDAYLDGCPKSEIKLVSQSAISNGKNEIIMPLSEFLGVNGESLTRVRDDDTLRSQDLVLVNVPYVQARPDITRFIISAREKEELRPRNLSVMVGRVGKQNDIFHVSANIVNELTIKMEDFDPYYLPKTVSYDVATKRGDCGSVVVLSDPARKVRKIIAIHVAGSPKLGKGFGSIFSLEELNNVMSKFPDRIIRDATKDSFLATPQMDIKDLKGFDYVEKAVGSVSIPIKTKITPSPLAGLVVSPTLMPATLAPQSWSEEPVSPWHKGYDAYCMGYRVIGPAFLEQALDSYTEMLFGNSSTRSCSRNLTFEEAICGVEGTQLGSISRTTSAGYPYITCPEFATNGRFPFFGKDDSYDLTTPECVELRSTVEEVISKAKRGERSNFVYVDYLKDELRTPEKVMEKKTRLVSACPIHLLVLYRMYFGSFQEWFVANRINNQAAIGVNVFSAEWNYIAERLLEKSGNGPYIGAGDYKGFDGSENPQIHEEILNIINSYYGDDNEGNLVRRVLWKELVNSKHYYNGHVFEWQSSLPSGHPLTAVINNMYNGIAFRYAWYASGNFKSDDASFNENVYLITMGDDNVFAVNPRYSKRFNELTLSEQLRNLGLTYTREDKSETDTRLRRLEEVEFLKRKWRYDSVHRRYVAPLRLSRLLETLNWSKEGPYFHEIPRFNVVTILRELSLHGKIIYDEWAPKIVKASEEALDYPPPVRTYRRNLALVLDSELYI